MHSKKVNSLTVLTVLILTALYIQNSQGQHGGRGYRRFQRPRHGGRRTGSMHPDIHQAYLDVYQQRPTTESSPRWAALTPSVPAENEIECYVEIVKVQLRGGRCIQLGGNTSRPFICQSGEQIEFSPYCQFLAEHQQPIEQEGQQQQQDLS